MIYSLVVLSDPASGSGSRHAAAFAREVLGRGHQLHRVFFLDAGTRCGNSCTVFPQEAADPVQDWAALAQQHDVELILCVTSALRHGLLDTREAERHERDAATVHPAFTISGLGQLIDAGVVSDRVVSFSG